MENNINYYYKLREKIKNNVAKISTILKKR